MHHHMDESQLHHLQLLRFILHDSVHMIFYKRQNFGQKRHQWFSGTGAGREVDYTGAQGNHCVMEQFYILIAEVFIRLYTFVKNSELNTKKGQFYCM